MGDVCDRAQTESCRTPSLHSQTIAGTRTKQRPRGISPSGSLVNHGAACNSPLRTVAPQVYRCSNHSLWQWPSTGLSLWRPRVDPYLLKPRPCRLMPFPFLRRHCILPSRSTACNFQWTTLMSLGSCPCLGNLNNSRFPCNPYIPPSQPPFVRNPPSSPDPRPDRGLRPSRQSIADLISRH